MEKVERPRHDNSRLVLTGAFCEQPPLGLIRTIERAGCSIVEDDFVLGSRWIQGDIAEVGDGLENIAQAYLTQSVDNASIYLGKGKKGAGLVARYRRRP